MKTFISELYLAKDRVGIRLTGLALVGLLCLTGCTQHTTFIDPAADAAMRHRIVSRAGKTFDRAVFSKPRAGTWLGLETTFAPLIVQEIDQEEVDSGNQAGIVYACSDHIIIGDARHDRVSYYWRWGGGGTLVEKSGHATLSWQGVRITIGLDGFPLVWEVLNSGERVAQLYVSESAEAAAKQAYGAPQQGTRFAIERSPEDMSRPVVVNVLSDGPVPMGPYIYLAQGSHEVTTILCRCSPSQMNEVVESRWYDLQPGDGAEVSSGLEFQEWRPLHERLRWPAGL